MPRRYEEPNPVETLDLAAVTRPGMTTRILLHGYAGTYEWIKCGIVEVQRLDYRNGATTLVNIRGPNGWTDFEHDTIKVASFELVGARFDGFWSSTFFMSGYFHPDAENLRIPSATYLEGLKKGTTPCKHCKGKDKHLMVGEGFYAPKADPELFEKIRGMRVEIQSTVTSQLEEP